MSALQMMATTLWTQILEALRQDGLIAHGVTQSGPATTKVIVDTVQATEDKPWLGMSVLPEPGREVIACDASGHFHVLTYNADHKSWMRGIASVSKSSYLGWRFVYYKAPGDGR